jgi:serine/threonine-protein kinase
MEPHENLELSPVKVGEVLAGKYRVERLLGAGGMGVVVLARHMLLDQLVALKFLLAESLTNAKVVARFEREARAVVKLKSEHVARVIDVGVMETGAPYIVMDYLEGEDLSMTIERRGQLPIAESVDYLLQACEALAEAHGAGIVHRDLKPGNLFLTKSVDGKSLIKVLDFGISKLDGGREDLALTQTTEVVGSPKYMSPEQLRASRLADARSDIWSMGVILYELITADSPFMAETLAHLCALVISDQPRPVRSLRPDVPPGIEAIILRCLEKDPARRFQTVADLAMALDPFVSNMQTSAAQRVQAVAAGSSGSFSKAPVPSGIVVGTSSQSTSIGWGATELNAGTAAGRGKRLVFGGVVVLVAIGIGAGAFLHVHGRHEVASTDPLAPTSSASASASSAASSSTAPAIASAATTASATASAIASASSSESAAPSHSSHPPSTHGPKKPHPAAPTTDDMPNERN